LSDNLAGVAAPETSPPPITASATATGPASKTASAGAPAAVRESAAHGPLPDDQTVTISAPSLGIFWRSPLPGAPPFVDVGDEVTPDTTVCIVEVMKLMNHVKAEVTGRVVEILAENGSPVEQGQALFTVVPAGT
jgi:acetyl-CoA carboxylase biotin carboxyl carrier protein